MVFGPLAIGEFCRFCTYAAKKNCSVRAGLVLSLPLIITLTSTMAPRSSSPAQSLS